MGAPGRHQRSGLLLRGRQGGRERVQGEARAGLARPLTVARLQDAAAWSALGLLVALLAWPRFAREVGLPQPSPPALAVALGLVPMAGAVALLRARGPRATALAAAADVAGALAALAWLALDDPAGWRGTAALAIIAAGLLLQALVDAVLLSGTLGSDPTGSDSNVP